MIIAILTGGKSTRFGSDKLTHRIEGKQVISHVVEELELLDGEIYFLGKAMDGYNLPSLPDHGNYHGPMAGLQSLVHSDLKGDLFLIAGDMPFVTIKTFQWYLFEAMHSNDLLIPKTNDGYEHVLHIYISERNRDLLKQKRVEHSAIYKLIKPMSNVIMVPEYHQKHFTNLNEITDI